MKNILFFFAAGCLGGLANSIALWCFGEYGLTQSIGVAISPSLTASWLYPRIVWGGIWGWLFLLPVANSRPFFKGAILSLFPTLVQLFVIFPYKSGHGIAGLELGLLTPVVVLVVNWIWGVVAALTIRLSK